MKFLRSLPVKITLSFVLLVFIMSASVFFFFLKQANAAIEEGLRDQLKAVAAATASQIDGDTVAKLKPGDENTNAFIGVRDALLKIRAENPTIHYSYIMKESGEGLAFVVDDSYGAEADAAKIGEEYVSLDPTRAEQDKAEIIAGLKGPTASSHLYTDQWGTFLSGYAPVVNSAGKPVGILGVDMDASVVTERQSFVGDSLYIFFGIGMLAATIFVAFFAITISRDIKVVNEMIINLTEENRKARAQQQKGLKRQDEIGDLANAAAALMEGNLRQKLER